MLAKIISIAALFFGKSEKWESEKRKEAVPRQFSPSGFPLSAFLFFASFTLALLLSGCTPAGPRALLKGQKYLDHGDIAGAVTQLHRATTLLATNASAWNYYGVALQRAGQPDDAIAAYQNALKLDRDLVEAHFNLGCLALEQNKPDLARVEFTAYTLRRPNEAIAWLKLGSAQLRAGDTASAERSFSTVYHMDANNPDALNGLGLARVQRGKYREAPQIDAGAAGFRARLAESRHRQPAISPRQSSRAGQFPGLSRPLAAPG
jgi:Flp pilus assembly protein TadD